MTHAFLRTETDGQLTYVDHGGAPDLRAVTGQVQLAVPLTPRTDDGDMDCSRRMTVDRPRPGHTGGGQPQIGPEEPAHTMRHLQGNLTVHRPGPLQVRGIDSEDLSLDSGGVGDDRSHQHT